MKRQSKLLALILAALLCLAACGSSSSGSTTDSAAAEEFSMSAAANYRVSNSVSLQEYEEDSAPAASIASGAESDTVAAEETDRKIVYSGSMTLQTKSFEEDLAAITALVKESGGYISSQETNGRSLTYSGSYYSRYANLTVRVPVDHFDSLMTGVSGLCNVTERSVWTEDISDTYYDAEAHLSTLQLQEERLLEILSKAEKLEDVITLEEALSDVRYEIESLTAQLRRMNDRVDYSTLTLSLNEVVEYSEIETEPETFLERLGDAARRSGKKIADFFENLVLWIVEDLPLVLLWCVLLGAVLWVAVRVLRFIFRKEKTALPAEKKGRKPLLRFLRKKKADLPPVDPPEEEKKE